MDIDQSLASHRFATLKAIREQRAELASLRLDAYVEFAKAYLDAALAKGIRFPRNSTHSISYMDFRTPTKIINDAADCILAAVGSENPDILRTGAFLPVKFMRLSIEKGDFLFYEKMSQLFSVMLAESYSFSKERWKSLVVDLSSRYLSEFADYLLPSLIAAHSQGLQKEFTTDLLSAFGELLKVALDRDDFPTFTVVSNDMNSVFQHLEATNVAKDAIPALREHAEQERAIVWFGLGGWVLRSFVLRNSKPEPGNPDLRLIDQARIPTYLNSIAGNFSNIKQLANTYFDALERDRGTSNWEWWMLQTLPERKPHWGGYDQWLTYFYVVAGLRISHDGTPTVSDIPVPHKDLEFRLNDIRKIVEDIKGDPDSWKSLIPWIGNLVAADAEPRWKYFITANEISANQLRQIREDKIIAATLDQRRIDTFSKQVAEGWQDSAWLVSVLTEMTKREERPWQAEAQGVRVYELQPKEFFIDFEDTALGPFGRFQGIGLGNGTNEQLLSQIVGGASDIGGCDINQVFQRTREIITSMNAGDSKLVVILRGDLRLERQFSERPEFEQHWQQQTPRFLFHEYVGNLDGIPVFHGFDQHYSEVVVCNLSKMGTLIWYIPDENNVGGLLIDVTPIDAQEAKQLLSAQPDLAKDAHGNVMQSGQAIRHFQLHVKILAEARFELTISDSNAVRKITVTEGKTFG